MEKQISYKNKKASFEFIFLDEYVAGVVLLGTEIKSIRNGGVSFSDSFCLFVGDELFLKNVNISEYKFFKGKQHLPTRDRKLLLNKSELKKLKQKSSEKGLTIIPSKIFINERGLAKVVVVLAKGKKLYDKRASLIEREAKRRIKDII